MLRKSIGVCLALGCLTLLADVVPLPKVVLRVESPGDARFQPHLARLSDVAARQLATQFVCVPSASELSVRDNQIIGLIATNHADGLLLFRAESLVVSDASAGSFVMRGAASSRLYTFRGSYGIFGSNGVSVAQGPLRATQMSFALMGLEVMSDSFISQLFAQAVQGFQHDIRRKPVVFSAAPAPQVEPVVTNNVPIVIRNVETNAVQVVAVTNVVPAKPIPPPVPAPVIVPVNPLLDRTFADIPNRTMDDPPQPVVPVRAVPPVAITITCTPCNPSEQAIFLPDIRLLDQHRVRKLKQKVPVQVACAVEVDGVIAGVAPVEVSLAPGEHRVRFEHQGFVPFESTIMIKEAGQLVFPLQMTEQGFNRWILSLRVFSAVESENPLHDDEMQMLKREVRRLHGSGIRLDTSRLDNEAAQTSLYRLGPQK